MMGSGGPAAPFNCGKRRGRHRPDSRHRAEPPDDFIFFNDLPQLGVGLGYLPVEYPQAL